MSRRYYYRRSGFFGLLQDLFDDVWDFVDDDILDRGWDTEWDLRHAGRRWFDDDEYPYRRDRGRRYDYDDRRYGRRRRHSRHRLREEELDDLFDEVMDLIKRVEVLTEARIEATATADRVAAIAAA